MNDKKYLLVVEGENNRFEPIYWKNPYICSIDEIDELTSRFNAEELNEYLISKKLLKPEEKDNKLQILYKNDENKIKKLSSGVLYADDKVDDMLAYSMDVIKKLPETQNGEKIIEELIKNIDINPQVSDQTKVTLNIMHTYKDFHYLSVNSLVEKLKNATYFDKRTIYFITKKVIEPLLAQNKSRSK